MRLSFALVLASLITVSSIAAARAADGHGSSTAASPPGARCSPGFVYMASTGGCLRLSGQFRNDVVATAPAHGRNATAMDMRGRLELDARVPTEAGPLRAVVRVNAQHRTPDTP